MINKGTIDNSPTKSGNNTFTGKNTFLGVTEGKTPEYFDNSSNFSTTAMVHNLNDTQRTNCITEIPQNINLELSSGTLTLKAGSKAYIPNGSGVFNAVTVTTDKTISSGLSNGLNFIEIDESNSNLSGRLLANSVSGANATATAGLAYDTTANRVGFYTSGGAISKYVSFPIAIVNVESSVITSIVKVFNGFGYIGSTIFVLPNVKGLIPSGRNSDGTLKNTSFSYSVVKTSTHTTNRKYFIRCSNNYMNAFQDQITYYDEEKNKIISNNVEQDQMIAGTFTVSGGKITEFEPCNVFNTLSFSNKRDISGWGLPSEKYINLTLGASGTSYVAPANGWVILGKNSDASGQFVNLYSMSVGSMIHSSANIQDLVVYIPVLKNETFVVTYNAGGNTNIFSFYYAKGEL